MRKLLAIVVLCLCSLPALGEEIYLGTVTSIGTSQVNSAADAGTGNFTLPRNQKISVQCDAAAYVLVSEVPTPVTSSTGVKVAADQFFVTSTPNGYGTQSYLQVISVTGTSNCKVWSRKGNEN